MKNVLNQIVAHRSGALAILVMAAFLETYGDSCFQTGLHRSSGISRAFAFGLGTVALAMYGLIVNLPRWDFGKLLGIYVVLFFLSAQLIAWLKFGQTPTIPVIAGGALIAAGGLVIAILGS
jgi:hypothetical protein